MECEENDVLVLSPPESANGRAHGGVSEVPIAPRPNIDAPVGWNNDPTIPRPDVARSQKGGDEPVSVLSPGTGRSRVVIPESTTKQHPAVLVHSPESSGLGSVEESTPRASTPCGSVHTFSDQADVSDEGNSICEDRGESDLLEQKRRGIETRPSSATEDINRTYSPGELSHELRNCIAVSAQGNQGFIPIDVFDRLITPQTVVAELRVSKLGARTHPPPLTDEGLWQIAQDVCTPYEYLDTRNKPKLTTRKKIFATLTMIEMAHEIVSFIQEGLGDNDLPLEFEQCNKTRPSRLYKIHKYQESPGSQKSRTPAPTTSTDTRERHNLGLESQSLPFEQPPALSEATGGEPRSIALRVSRAGEVFDTQLKHKEVACCSTWTDFNRESFAKYQWMMLAPVFIEGKAGSPHEKPKYYPLDQQTILPFTLNEEQGAKTMAGHSLMFKIKIHPAHNKFHGGDGEVVYARKQLFTDDQATFDMEVEALRKVIAKGHSHLIKLLVTYKQGKYNLIFPWADGNLRSFWSNNPDGPMEATGHTRDTWALWLAEQCHGIVAGLNLIHHVELNTSSELKADRTQKVYGRHGDIKPENILWFRTYDNDRTGIGVLKISDFGLTRFHSYISRTDVNAGATGTYRAPEYDIHQKVSQKYDLWGLGCLFLEFATWYLLGYEAMQKSFCDQRLSDDPGETFQEDTFFRTIEITGRTWAEVKPSVLGWIQHLREQKQCTQYLHDMLDCVETELLVVDPSERAACGPVVNRFKRMLEKCKKSESYRLLGLPKPHQADITDTSKKGFPVKSLPGRRAHPSQSEMVDSYTITDDELPSTGARVNSRGRHFADAMTSQSIDARLRAGPSPETPTSYGSHPPPTAIPQHRKLARAQAGESSGDSSRVGEDTPLLRSGRSDGTRGLMVRRKSEEQERSLCWNSAVDSVRQFLCSCWYYADD